MRFQKEEIAAFAVLACALLAVGALFLLTGTVSPYTGSSRDGDRVSVTGVVLSKDTTYKGGHVILTVKADTGPMSVFVPASSDGFPAANRTVPGSKIEAIGKVQTYKGKPEIVAESIEIK